MTGTLDLDGYSNTIGSLAGAGTVTNSSTTTAATLSTNALNNASTTFLGDITDTGTTGILGLTKQGTGTLTLSGTDSYHGATTINGGTLKLSGSGSIASSSDVIDDGNFDISATSGASIVTLSGTSSGIVTLGNETLTLTDPSTTFSGAIDGTGGLTVDGTGTETLTGDNGYSGVTTIDSGDTLKLSGSGSIASSSDVIDDGTFDISATSGASIVTLSGTSSGIVTLGNETLTLTDPSTTFNGAIDGAGGLTVDGTGTETLTGDNLYSGVTTIDSGDTLKLSGTGSISDSSDVIDDGTFKISGTTSGASIVTLSGTSSGIVTLGNETLTLSNASTTFNGAIRGAGGLTLTAGTEMLTGDNGYTGVTTINGGTLKLSGTGSIASSSDVIDDSTFDISATSGASIVTLSGTSSGIVTLGNETLTLSNASTTFGGAIDGTGGLTVYGFFGTEMLSGDNLYTGATMIGFGFGFGGTLALSGSGSIADTSDVTDDGTFDISATSGASIKTLSGTGIVTLGTETLTLTDPSTTFSGAIGGTGGLTVDGTGTETLSGDNNTYSGVATIDSGDTLAAGVADAFSANSAVTDNGELDLGSADQTIKALNGTNTAALVGSFSGTGTGPAVLTISDGGSFAGVIENGSAGAVTALTLTGGTETLSGLNTYSGVTTIDSGARLALSGTGSISDSSDVIDDGTFKISGTTSGASIVTLSGDGTVTLGAQTLTLTDASTTFSGAIGGTGGLTLTAGTETLTGDDTYSGTTTINGGKLQVDDNFNGTGTVTISGGGVADFLGTFNQGVTFTGAGTLELARATTGAVTGFDPGAALDLTNLKFATNDTVTWAQTTDDSGTLTVTHGTTSEQFTLEGIYNTGDFALIANPFGSTGTEVVFNSTGTVIIAGDGDDDADDNVHIYGSSANPVKFEGSAGTLFLDQPLSFTGEISGLSGAGDVLDLKGFAAGTTTAVTGPGSFHSGTDTTTLTVHDSSDGLTDTRTLAGNLSLSSWNVTPDGHGGVDIVDPPAPAKYGRGSDRCAHHTCQQHHRRQRSEPDPDR